MNFWFYFPDLVNQNIFVSNLSKLDKIKECQVSRIVCMSRAFSRDATIWHHIPSVGNHCFTLWPRVSHLIYFVLISQIATPATTMARLKKLIAFLIFLNVIIIAAVVLMIIFLREEWTGLENTRGILYVISSIIQSEMAIIAFFYVYLWWERKKRKDDRKVADSLKIATIPGEKLGDVEISFDKLKTGILSELRNETLNTVDRSNFTKFHVLLYMYHCHWKNILENNSNARHSTTRNDTVEVLQTVISHVNQIMKLFIEFRVQLSSIEDKECPEYIKEEFSSEIIEMGKTIYPFVSKHRQKTIEKVLKYFDYPPNTTQVSNTAAVEENPPSDTNERCTVLSSNQGASFQSGLSAPVPEQRSGGEAGTVRSASADEGLIPYAGHDAIINAIPYIDHFQYVNGEMKCNLECRYSAIKTLERHVQRKTAGVMEKEQEIKEEIRILWSSHSPKTVVPNNDFLHLIRMVMYELKSFGVEAIKLFDEYVQTVVKNPVNYDKAFIIRTCTRTLEDLISIAKSLPGDRTAYLLEDIDTAEFLQSQVNALRDFSFNKF